RRHHTAVSPASRSACGTVVIAREEVTTRGAPGTAADGYALREGATLPCLEERGCWLRVSVPPEVGALYEPGREHWITAGEAGRRCDAAPSSKEGSQRHVRWSTSDRACATAEASPLLARHTAAPGTGGVHRAVVARHRGHSGLEGRSGLRT